MAASGIGDVGQVLGNAVISMSTNALTQAKSIAKDDTDSTTFSVSDMIFDGVVSAVAASFSGDGASYGNVGGINKAWDQLSKRGFFDKKALSYFYTTAHNSDGKFVLTTLAKSFGFTCVGSAIITTKNNITKVLGR